MDKEKNTKKIMIYVAVAVIITLILSYMIFVFLPSYKKQAQAETYKKVLFESLLCQHKCPLTSQVFLNQTSLLPDLNCVGNCTENAKEKIGNINPESKDLTKDNLFNDIANTIAFCKNQSMINSTLINNSNYFSCASKQLENLPKNYSYLK